MIRNPVVAGQFYPASASELKAMIEGMVKIEEMAKEEVIGLVLPHAGYIYSGPVAGAVVSRIRFKDTFIIMGPNHTGAGKPLSIMTEGKWKTPHPAKLSIERPEKLGRGILILRLFFGWAYIGIPHGLCLFFYGIGVCFAAIYAWFVVLFTGKYPEGVFKFIEGYFRWQWRVNAYWMFMTDAYPPFTSDPEA